MRKCQGEARNDRFIVGCNGATVYIYDKDGTELAKFKDFPYAYRAVFKPGTNILAVKSTAGYLGFYDLDSLTLIKKIVVTRLGAQDEGFAFTPDGRYFYNIEKPRHSARTQLGIYEAESFTKVHTVFEGEDNMVLEYIEFDPENSACYFTGFFHHGNMGNMIAEFDTETLTISRIFTNVAVSDCGPLNAYKKWESYGLSQKVRENDYSLKNRKEELRPVTIKEVFEKYQSMT